MDILTVFSSNFVMEAHASLVCSSAMAIIFSVILRDSFMEQREGHSFFGYVQIFVMSREGLD